MSVSLAVRRNGAECEHLQQKGSDIHWEVGTALDHIS